MKLNEVKRYSLDDIQTLISKYKENQELNLVKLYPSSNKMVEQLILANEHASEYGYKRDIDYIELAMDAKDRWKFGFVDFYDASESEFVLTFEKERFDWAINLIEDISERLNIDKILEWQNEIYDKPEIQEEIAIVVEYYSRTGYFHNIINKVKYGSKLTPEEYNKLCCNKYASKVIAGFRAIPKYEVGDIVYLRGTMILPKYAKGFVVISNTEQIISAKKGNKRYKLLPIGGSSLVLKDECDIKKRK